MRLAERDHARETLLFDRADEPFGIGVEIGTLRREPNWLDTGALQDLAEDPRIEGIAVVNQKAGRLSQCVTPVLPCRPINTQQVNKNALLLSRVMPS